MQVKEWTAIMTGGLLSSWWTANNLSQSFLHSFSTRQFVAQWVPSKLSGLSEMVSQKWRFPPQSFFCGPEPHSQQAGQPGWLAARSQQALTGL